MWLGHKAETYNKHKSVWVSENTSPVCCGWQTLKTRIVLGNFIFLMRMELSQKWLLDKDHDANEQLWRRACLKFYCPCITSLVGVDDPCLVLGARGRFDLFGIRWLICQSYGFENGGRGWHFPIWSNIAWYCGAFALHWVALILQKWSWVTAQVLGRVKTWKYFCWVIYTCTTPLKYYPL